MTLVRLVETGEWPYILMADEHHPLWRDDEAVEVDSTTLALLHERLNQHVENMGVISAILVDLLGADNEILARREI